MGDDIGNSFYQHGSFYFKEIRFMTFSDILNVFSVATLLSGVFLIVVYFFVKK